MSLLHESRRTAVGMAAQCANGNEDEYNLLLSSYVDDACDGGQNCGCRVKALMWLAAAAVELAVFTSRNNAEFFTRMAQRMVVHGE